MSRKLDKWLAQEVFGNNYIEIEGAELHRIGPSGIEYLPFYTVNIASALDVMKKLQDMYPCQIFHLWWDSAWFLETEQVDSAVVQLDHHMTNPAMSICRGAYKQITGENWNEDNL